MGKFIGYEPIPNTQTAGGIWNLRNVVFYESLNSWPSIDIVKDGLVAYWDASSPLSYPGSGTTFLDKSGNGYSAVFVGTPTFTDNYFTLDGSTDSFDVYQTGAGFDTTTITNNFSFEMVVMPTATHGIDAESTSGTGGTSGQRYIIEATNAGADGGAGVSIGTNGVSVYEHGSSYMPALLVNTTAISGTVPTHITVVYTNKQPSLYINGSWVDTGLTSLKTTVKMGGQDIGQGSSYGWFQGRVYAIAYYNKSLSATEISDNHIAFTDRFNL